MPSQQLARGLMVGDDRVSHVGQACQRMISSLLVSEATGILNQNRHETQVAAVPARGINSYFQGNSGNDETANAAISQGDCEQRTLKSRHRDLVDDAFARQRLQLRNNLKSRAISKEHGTYLFRRIHPLPG